MAEDVLGGIVRKIKLQRPEEAQPDGMLMTFGDANYAVGKNGFIYVVPTFSGRHVIEIDPVSGSCRKLAGPLERGVYNDEGLYKAVAVASNGCLYAPPFHADRVLEINPASGTVRQIGPKRGSDAPYMSHYTAIAAAPNGCLYAPPGAWNPGKVLEINPVNGTVSFIGEEMPAVDPDPYECYPYYGSIAVADNGHLYAPPLCALRVLRIDPFARTVSLIGDELEADRSFSLRYQCIVAASNGKLYSPPFDAEKVLEIDPAIGTVQEIGEKVNEVDDEGDFIYGYPRICAGSTGHLYAVAGGWKTGRFVEIDPSRGAATMEPLQDLVQDLSSGSDYGGMAHEFAPLAGNGRMYGKANGTVLEFNPTLRRFREIAIDKPGAWGDSYNVRPVLVGGGVVFLHRSGRDIVNVTCNLLPTWGASVGDALWGALTAGEVSDVTIRTTQGKSYCAHKVVLLVRSRVFRSMFSSSMREAADGVVDLGDVSPSVSDFLIQHIYGKKWSADSITVQEVCELSVLAHRYELVELLQTCAVLLGDSVTVNNAALVLRLADQLQLVDLKQDCLDFVVAHPQVTQTDEWEKVTLELLREVTEAFGGLRRKRRRPEEWEYNASSEWERLTVPQLRRACAERGLAQDGDKPSLLERLQA